MFHIAGPAESGEGGAAAMQNALNDAQLNEDLGYLNARDFYAVRGRGRNRGR